MCLRLGMLFVKTFKSPYLDSVTKVKGRCR